MEEKPNEINRSLRVVERASRKERQTGKGGKESIIWFCHQFHINIFVSQFIQSCCLKRMTVRRWKCGDIPVVCKWYFSERLPNEKGKSKFELKFKIKLNFFKWIFKSAHKFLRVLIFQWIFKDIEMFKEKRLL